MFASLRRMDTRYWGPSGWRLLHLISFTAEVTPSTCEFFKMIPYILPCKYCRKSLSEYMIADPVECNKKNLPKWLWRIHNDVSHKLRAHRMHVEPDPKFSIVEKIYSERLAAGCSRTVFEGWEFLFSIAEAHPYSRAAKGSTPIADHPPLEDLKTPLERNMWNVMTSEERMPYYNRFWELLPSILPFPEWRKIWKQAASATGSLHCREGCLKYLWSIRRHMEKNLELINQTNYDSLCKELRNNRSGCTRSVRGKTCRRKLA
jgi:Erv1 / Alr family